MKSSKKGYTRESASKIAWVEKETKRLNRKYGAGYVYDKKNETYKSAEPKKVKSGKVGGFFKSLWDY